MLALDYLVVSGGGGGGSKPMLVVVELEDYRTSAFGPSPLQEATEHYFYSPGPICNY